MCVRFIPLKVGGQDLPPPKKPLGSDETRLFELTALLTNDL